MSTDTPYALDIEKLLAPISAERPSGEPLRYEGTYDRIREARREDDPSLSRGIYEIELKRADWPSVESIAIEALETRTKDLQIAAWLTEGWLQLYGFAGVRDGLRLMAELCARFWDDLHPQPDGGDFAGRVASVNWVNEKLSLKLKLLDITAPQNGDTPSYTYADWERACYIENLSHRDPKAAKAAEARGEVTPSQFKTSAALTDRYFFVEIYDDLSGAFEVCEAFEQMLDEKCGKDGPSLYQFKEALKAIGGLAADVLRSRPEERAYATAGEGDEEEYVEGLDDGGEQLWPSGPIRSRKDAYRRLAEAADYLMRTEPHSPTPYLIMRAVEWGEMSLQEVLQQIVSNDGEMKELNRLLRLSPDAGNRK
jgi:type VI secretion system protein ImpA